MPSSLAAHQAQAFIRLSGFGFGLDGDIGRFARKSGGNVTASVRRYHEGGDFEERITGGPKTADDMTIERPFVLARDLPLYRRARNLTGRARGKIQVQFLDADGRPYGRPLIHTGVLSGATAPDIDADGVGTNMNLTLTFAVETGLG